MIKFRCELIKKIAVKRNIGMVKFLIGMIMATIMNWRLKAVQESLCF